MYKMQAKSLVTRENNKEPRNTSYVVNDTIYF